MSKWGWMHSGYISMGYKKKLLTEVEIKVSIADLKADQKKYKYEYNKRMKNHGDSNYFYFAVPEIIAEKALEVVAYGYSGAGLLVISEDETNNFITVKRSKRTDGDYSSKLPQMMYRATAELAKLIGG